MTVLALDISGIPRQWISFNDAIKYHAAGAVAWSLGEPAAYYRGGVQRNGDHSYLETSDIIAIRGHGFDVSKHTKVTLTNRTLFGRDRMTCGYCGHDFTNYKELSRDHIVPVSRGGTNTWMNTITACKPCNNFKGARLLKECGLDILFPPYVPTHIENMMLRGYNLSNAQINYMSAMIPKHSRLVVSRAAVPTVSTEYSFA